MPVSYLSTSMTQPIQIQPSVRALSPCHVQTTPDRVSTNSKASAYRSHAACVPIQHPAVVTVPSVFDFSDDAHPTLRMTKQATPNTPVRKVTVDEASEGVPGGVGGATAAEADGCSMGTRAAADVLIALTQQPTLPRPPHPRQPHTSNRHGYHDALVSGRTHTEMSSRPDNSGHMADLIAIHEHEISNSRAFLPDSDPLPTENDNAFAHVPQLAKWDAVRLWSPAEEKWLHGSIIKTKRKTVLVQFFTQGDWLPWSEWVAKDNTYLQRTLDQSTHELTQLKLENNVTAQASKPPWTFVPASASSQQPRKRMKAAASLSAMVRESGSATQSSRTDGSTIVSPSLSPPPSVDDAHSGHNGSSTNTTNNHHAVGTSTSTSTSTRRVSRRQCKKPLGFFCDSDFAMAQQLAELHDNKRAASSSKKARGARGGLTRPNGAGTSSSTSKWPRHRRHGTNGKALADGERFETVHVTVNVDGMAQDDNAEDEEDGDLFMVHARAMAKKSKTAWLSFVQ
eukprot:m.170443 g.170443  ORF g.170443 m.170443 type:complete len:510 (-) comp13242_c0_seq1:119-1648(-)